MKKKNNDIHFQDLAKEELQKQGYPSEAISLLLAMDEHLIKDISLEMHLAHYIHKCVMYEKKIKELERRG